MHGTMNVKFIKITVDRGMVNSVLLIKMHGMNIKK